ncbi:MAG: Gfo/Idh/MocA family oxidoreductase [bacterium]
MKKSSGQKKISYGIIGCGDVFLKHAEAVRKNPESRLAAVFDIRKSRGRAASLRYRCEAKPAIEAMLGDKNIDVVGLCTPHNIHKQQVLKTIRAGKHCICEKPFCLNSRDGRAILRDKHCRKNIFVVFQVRFHPAVQFLLHLIRAGELGKIRLCTVNVRKNRDNIYFKNDWRKSRKKAGGILFSHGIHALDLMFKICGRPKTVCGFMKNVRKFTDIEDFCLASVEFENGALGSIEVTTYAKNRNYENSIFVIGDRGSIKIGGCAFDKIEYLNLADGRGMKEITGARRNGHERFIAAVNDYLLRRRRHIDLPFAEDGMRVAAFIEKIYRKIARQPA